MWLHPTSATSAVVFVKDWYSVQPLPAAGASKPLGDAR